MIGANIGQKQISDRPRDNDKTDVKVRQIKDFIVLLVRQMHATARQMHRWDTPGADARWDKCKATQMQSWNCHEGWHKCKGDTDGKVTQMQRWSKCLVQMPKARQMGSWDRCEDETDTTVEGIVSDTIPLMGEVWLLFTVYSIHAS